MEAGRTDNETNDLAQFQKRICSWALMSAVILAALLILFHEKAIAKGLVLGTLFSIINFVLMGRSIPMSLGRSRRSAGVIGFASIFGRYIVLAIPMIIAIKVESISFVAVVAGIFAVQIVTLVDYLIIRPAFTGKSS
jgi:hypothetical protein